MSRKLTQDEVIAQFENMGHELDSFEKVEYLGDQIKVTIVCADHGEYSTTPSIYKQGHRCKKCATDRNIINQTHTQTRAIEILNQQTFAYLDTFETVDYVNGCDQITINCIEHGPYSTTFTQYVNSHTRCRTCAWQDQGYNSKNYDSYKCYIIECDEFGEHFYKIGRCFTTVNYRFNCKQKMPYRWEPRKVFTGSSAEMFNLELKLQKLCKNEWYIPNLEFNGSKGECFSSITNIQSYLD